MCSWLTKLGRGGGTRGHRGGGLHASFRAQLIWDDGENVTTNETLRSWDGLRQMWLIPQSIQQYYPLMYTTYWVEYHLRVSRSTRLPPRQNVALHAAASVLVWQLLVRLRVPGAWLAAVLFAVHPVAVESVAWVTERKNVLSLCLAVDARLLPVCFAGRLCRCRMPRYRPGAGYGTGWPSFYLPCPSLPKRWS